MQHIIYIYIYIYLFIYLSIYIIYIIYIYIYIYIYELKNIYIDRQIDRYRYKKGGQWTDVKF